MPDLKTLETRLAKEKGYGGRPQLPDGVAGFVCPRANAYGGREGIIPPGIAAQRGLVPKGMRRVTVQQALANDAERREAGLTEHEQYRAYYGRGAQDQAAAAPEAPAAPPKRTASVPKSALARALKARLAKAPAATPAPAPARPAAKRAAPKPTRPAKPAKPTKKPAKQAVKKAYRMFSLAKTAVPADDTLDAFYETTGDIPHGTDETPAPVRRRPAEPEFDAAGNEVPPPPTPPAQEDAGASEAEADDEIVAIVEQIAGERDSARAAYAELRRDYLALEQENARLRQEAAERPEAEHGILRVQLATEDVKLKVGGRGWECRVMGHLDYAHGRGEVMLTVMDPAYASELINEIQRGPCVIVSERGRTACAYHGDCAKIYGDPGSSAFITCFRFGCEADHAEA